MQFGVWIHELETWLNQALHWQHQENSFLLNSVLICLNFWSKKFLLLENQI